ncbi:radical SAM protein [Erysipelotrichaceae bacterium 66-17]
MKESNYNKFFEREDLVIAYNARTNALAEISKEDYNQILQWRDSKKDLRQELEKDLSYGGFLIPDKINETDLIKHTVMASRYATKVLNLTIAPTSNCNFRCPYCYERNSLNEKRMNDTTANDILKMIEDRIPHLEAIDLTWYGGEPLLELERI